MCALYVLLDDIRMIDELETWNLPQSCWRNSFFVNILVITFDFLQCDNYVCFDITSLENFAISAFAYSFEFLILLADTFHLIR